MRCAQVGFYGMIRHDPKSIFVDFGLILDSFLDGFSVAASDFFQLFLFFDFGLIPGIL